MKLTPREWTLTDAILILGASYIGMTWLGWWLMKVCKGDFDSIEANFDDLKAMNEKDNG